MIFLNDHTDTIGGGSIRGVLLILRGHVNVDTVLLNGLCQPLTIAAIWQSYSSFFRLWKALMEIKWQHGAIHPGFMTMNNHLPCDEMMGEIIIWSV